MSVRQCVVTTAFVGLFSMPLLTELGRCFWGSSSIHMARLKELPEFCLLHCLLPPTGGKSLTGNHPGLTVVGGR